MRTFNHPNTRHGWKCPICNTDEDKSVVLVGIAGTEDGNNIQAEQFHLECLDLTYHKEAGILGMKVAKKEER